MTDLLRVEGLRTEFPMAGGGAFAAVDGVDLAVARGRTLGIVGESGCGKSMLSLSVMRLVPPPGRIAAGRINFDGRDLLDLSPGVVKVQSMRALARLRVLLGEDEAAPPLPPEPGPLVCDTSAACGTVPPLSIASTQVPDAS